MGAEALRRLLSQLWQSALVCQCTSWGHFHGAPSSGVGHVLSKLTSKAMLAGLMVHEVCC